MPYEDTANKLIDAGPFVSLAIAFLLGTIVLLGMMIIINRMFKAFIDLQRSTNEQTKLTREAMGKIDDKVVSVGVAIARVADATIDNRIEIKRLAALVVNRFELSEQKMNVINVTLTDNLLPIMNKLDAMSTTVMELEVQVVNAYQTIIDELNKTERKPTDEELKILADSSNIIFDADDLGTDNS